MEFKLILVVVDIDKTDAVLEAVLASGATGATVISRARGLGLSKPIKLWGLELFNSRDVILVIVESANADAVMEAALRSGQLDETRGTGLALQLDVEKAVGLSEHIKFLKGQSRD